MYNYLKFNKSTTVCFTGHRSTKLPWGYNEEDDRCKILKNRLGVEINKCILDGYDTFICGMALGFDMICAEIVLGFKVRYPYIKLIGALPCENQDSHWSEGNRTRYANIKYQLDGVRCLNKSYQGYECMLERNKFMVDNSSLVIALFDGLKGGTKYTIDYARRAGLQVIELRP